MTTQNLINLLNQADFITTQQKKHWVKKIPYLSNDHLKRLEGILLWAKKQKNNLQKEQDLIMILLMKTLAAMNKYSLAQTKKILLESLKTNFKKIELNQAEKIIKQINNDNL